MKKLVITLVIASLYSGAALAQGAAKQIKEGAGAVRQGREGAIRPGQQGTGSKITGSATGATGSAGRQAEATNTRAESTGVNSHYTCPTDSVVRFLDKDLQASMQAATGAGVGGNACASNFESKETAEVVARAQKAGYGKLKSMNLTDVKQANNAQLIEIGDAMILAISRLLNISLTEANERFMNMCANNCDVASAELCKRGA